MSRIFHIFWLIIVPKEKKTALNLLMRMILKKNIKKTFFIKFNDKINHRPKR